MPGILGPGGVRPQKPKPTLGPLSAERVKKLLTSGKRPKYGSQQKEVRTWLRANKGWVGKNWQALNKTQYGRTVLTNSGFNIRDNMKDRVRLTNRETGDKTIWSWAREKPYSGPPIKGTTTKTTKSSPSGDKTKPSPNGDTSGSPRVGGIDSNDQLLNIAIARLMSLDPSAGQKPYDPAALLAGLSNSTSEQTRLIRSQMEDLQNRQKFNTDAIDKWWGQVGKSVDTARERGVKMTGDLGTALASNNQGLIESIGGSAAMGASPVGQSMQQGQNTLSAMGAADAQFLNDMGPLLQGEGASLKAREVARISQMRKQMQDEMRSTITDGGAKRAELALQIAQLNNEQGQQAFQNRASLAETLAGLAMSGQKLTAQQQQFVTKLIADQQKQAASAQQKGTKNKLQQLNEWRDSLPSYEDAQAAGWGPVDGVPRQELVTYIRNRAREAGLDTRDPQVINAMIGAIQAYGGKVPPEWVKGWR